jgi:hypothetical protein
MEYLMSNFLTDQILGLNGLVNLSNLVFLLAFSVRDVLKLRILSVTSYGLILPYYFFSPNRYGRRFFGEWLSSLSMGFEL